ncbi:MAG TPA: ribosomal protein S18-alanine N-acetyltransferase [Nitrospinota bacterium]|nr:ribosomal protein S18-alanine N-acetyltransferase [Nitrospinota bacterium]
MNVIKERIDIDVVEMVEGDLNEVLEIEKTSFSSPWSKETFLIELKENEFSRILLAKAKDKSIYRGILGYCCYWIISDEIHITNIAIHSRYRRRGIGEQLLRFLIKEAIKIGAKLITLELRISNVSARALYKKLGFIPVAIRKKYYTIPKEDALIMLLKLEE